MKKISGVVVLEGNGQRASHHGDGYMESEIMYTLNTAERHGVSYAATEDKTLVLNDQGGGVMNCSEDVTGTLRSQTKGHEPTIIEMTSTKNTIVENGISPTLTARMGTGGNQVNAVQCLDAGWLDSHEEQATTLLARQYKDPPVVCGAPQMGNHIEEPACTEETYQNITGPLMASGYEKLGTQEARSDMYVTGQVVRRLTPEECEALQGFPKGWTDIGDWTDSNGKLHKAADSPRYKALGNSIAIPFWFYLLRRIAAQYERPATLGSLFDGIGGFPLAWERCNGPGTALWASEIEEFPIAVTKVHFPEREEE